MDDVARRNRLRATFDGVASARAVGLHGDPPRAAAHLLGPPRAADDLLDCIDGLIDARYSGRVVKRYLAELVVASRR
ncbi:hypothetical protein [Pseudonocardia charpentierae]|uniref:Uncharacterized protein n=1 Tax=Pseudonocardia charpentierae TaxID=3075545 RepID=A0ABU2N4I1_9PSEU|nr:hypothetical protein [Pseudonocardia sp. DSM 45834]MDT0348224.1 hypothetical protein [Pseudonocardia sp. DSM 45834]